MTIVPPNDGMQAGNGLTHHYVDTNGIRLHYVAGGSGPLVMLLHGFPYTWEIWSRLMPILIAQGRRVVAPDLRGHGFSDKPNDGYEKTNVVSDLRGLVAALGETQIDLIGMDIGAMVAATWAIHHPADLRRLVLSESLIPGFGLEEMMNPATGGYWHFGFHAQVDVATMLISGREESYLLPTLKMMSAPSDAEQTARDLFLPHLKTSAGLRGVLAHYGPLVADGQENRWALDGRLKLPVLILAGAKGLPPKKLVEGARDIASDVVTATPIADAGHVYAWDNPEGTADKLMAFLKLA
ncbi:MAG: hypothetical protein JWQ22_2360 [Devosia sp.]|nr:hypothetical protein [Devosia sp.]